MFVKLFEKKLSNAIPVTIEKRKLGASARDAQEMSAFRAHISARAEYEFGGKRYSYAELSVGLDARTGDSSGIKISSGFALYDLIRAWRTMDLLSRVDRIADRKAVFYAWHSVGPDSGRNHWCVNGMSKCFDSREAFFEARDAALGSAPSDKELSQILTVATKEGFFFDRLGAIKELFDCGDYPKSNAALAEHKKKKALDKPLPAPDISPEDAATIEELRSFFRLPPKENRCEM